MAEPHLFSKIDADRILKRAADFEGAEDAAPLGIEELRAIAGEAGFGSRAVERAIVEALNDRPDKPRRHPVQRSGLVVTYLSTVRTLPIELSSEQLIRSVRLFQPYREGPARVTLEERQITWRDRKGLRFTVVSGGGTTDIRVFLSRVVLRRGRWTEWVKSAADQLEALVYLVASRDQTEGTHGLEVRLIEPEATSPTTANGPPSSQKGPPFGS